jgi:hypothetical protein
MSEFKLERFKYIWKGDWVAGTNYNRDDVVRRNGVSYVCLITHTADADFNVDLTAILEGSNPPQPAPKWTIMTESKFFTGNWSTGYQYEKGDLTLFDGTIWLCTEGHLSTVFSSDAANWTAFAKGIEFKTDWTAGTNYGEGAIVKYNGIVYKCVNPHEAGVTLEQNLTDWSVFHLGIEFAGDWQTDTLFRKNDLVKFGGTIFRCTRTHVSANFFNNAYFDIEFPGYKVAGEWDINTLYAVGDVVTFGGDLFYCNQSTVMLAPDETPDDSVPHWLPMLESYNFRGDWTEQEVYYPGDLVRRGGELYKSLARAGVGDGSTLDYTDDQYWELVVPGKVWLNSWVIDTKYEKGDVIYYFGDTWVANIPHTASFQNFPGDNGSGFEYWDLLVQAGDPAGMNFSGDLLTYNLSRDEIGDQSTLGPTNVPIGDHGQVLSVNSIDEKVYYRKLYDYAQSTTVLYVSPAGDDNYNDGLSPLTPFRTVRRALQYAEDNFDGAPTEVKVATGRYEEVCPMIVPAYCAIFGDELRSVTIVANNPKEEYQDDWQYVDSYLTHLDTVMVDLLQNNPITATIGNEETQVFNGQPANLDTAFYFQDRTAIIKEYATFRLEDGESDPVIVGTNDQTTNINYTRARAIIANNLHFLKAEVNAYLNFTFPGVTFDPDRVAMDVGEFLRAISLDMLYEGSNYYTIQSARYYVNSTLGSQSDDMFYLRDTTGLRNCTVEGLSGNLNPPGVFQLYQRPTGGAYCALDPGWGPDDDRCWILNRSPYIQGVTTIGNNCIGQRIDGSVHNGGNKSFVSNDFTQVLSDGIGAWVLNNARAELVSVFTYYCAVGYLAEDGGVIRATNGNNSYGKYGAIADGIDSSEVPKTGTVNNRENEAEVLSAFAGEITDFILAFEYRNAGNHYTSATADIVGAGNFANTVFEDFRDGALFEPRLTSAADSSRIGGAGFTLVGNNAQTGDATSITLSGTDDNVEATYLGLRIVITSGVGTGQYGYITSYDNVTKIATVAKESDDQPGWDHIVPGTPIASLLQLNTVYRIEPRLIVSHPGFNQTLESMPNSSADKKKYTDVTWGGTTEIYGPLVADLGNGTLIDADPTPAQFRITKSGRNYSVVMTRSGAGYAVGDTFVFSGDDLGGSSPENDLTIVVTETTDDSTDSIINYRFEGVGFTGRWTAIAAEGNYAVWSDDGESWTATELPAAGAWHKVINGGNTFVAIRNESSDTIAYSRNGKDWSSASLPITGVWKDIAYGNGRFVAIQDGSQEAIQSQDGINWTQTDLPAGDDSSGDQWQAIAFGQNKFIVVSGSQTKDVAYSTNGTSWQVHNNALPAGDFNFVALEYGNGRYLGITSNTTTAVYSLDGETWYTSSMPSPDDSTAFNWHDVKYGQGVFFAVGDTGSRTYGDPTGITSGPTTYCATSEDGIYWTERTFNIEREWRAIGFGSPNYDGHWIAVAYDDNDALKIRTGCRAKLRADIQGGVVNIIKIWDPGSGYTDAAPPEISVVDNTYTVEFITQNRVGNGALAQPSFINRGLGYRTSSTRVTITGDGFADVIPQSNELILDNLEVYPGIGAQIRITGILDEDTADPDDLKVFSASRITPLETNVDGTLKALIQITPTLENEFNLQHDTAVTIRENYSQCRISGHDFLDIGTGNFEETNYPDLYASGNYFVAAPENEVYEANGGRVFYTSTDQDGNFRAGELFSVQQASGIVTISAEFFDLQGLSELALGGVRLGGSGTVVREFSTDPNFTEDSNNIVPTQRAISTFLANRLSEGGSEIETNILVAGLVRVGTDENIITHTAGDNLNKVRFLKKVNFDGANANSTRGMLWAQRYFMRNG